MEIQNCPLRANPVSAATQRKMPAQVDEASSRTAAQRRQKQSAHDSSHARRRE